jgi:membrane protein
VAADGCNGVVAALAIGTDRVRRAAPYQRAMRGPVDFLKTYLTEFQKNDLPGLSAELAYRFLFAIFPFGLFVAALTAFVAQGIGMNDPSGQIMGALGDNLPPDVAAAVQPELQRVLDVARPGLLTIGALAALWAATGGTNALIKGTNKAFEVEDKRSFVVKTALAIALTLLATIGILVAFVTIVGGSLLTEQLAEQVGIGGAWQTISLIRWPLVAVALTLAVAILFHFAPAIRPSWRWCIVGGVVFTVGWLATTALFAFYVSNVANFGATYGALGGVIALMLWFYITGLLLTGSAQLAAVLMRRYEPDRLRELQGSAGTAAKVAATAKDAAGTAAQGVGIAAGTVAGAGSTLAEEDAPRPRRRPVARPQLAVERPESTPGDAVRAGGIVALGVAAGAVAARLIGRDEDDAATA